MNEPAMKTNSGGTFVLPAGISFLESQVAGHQTDPSKNSIRMLRTSNDCVLKAGGKGDLQEREVLFYEKVKNSSDPLYRELSELIPKYHGTRDIEIGNKKIQFVVLEDITSGMTEPCVMDIKIGERTWDPLATEAKRAAEDKKYVDSRKAYGFCIPGFQVYDLSTGDLRKFKKDYGKKLNERTVVEALKIFLNAENTPVCQKLLQQLISSLKRIQVYFEKQRELRFYASSILVTYDSHVLRKIREKENSKSAKECMPNEFNECSTSATTNVSSQSSGSSPSRQFPHENAITNGETNSELTEDCPKEINWLRVKMIDFTHVFSAVEEDSLDINYLQGITNLIKILESMTRDDQIN